MNGFVAIGVAVGWIPEQRRHAAQRATSVVHAAEIMIIGNHTALERGGDWQLFELDANAVLS